MVRSDQMVGAPARGLTEIRLLPIESGNVAVNVTRVKLLLLRVTGEPLQRTSATDSMHGSQR